MGEATTRDNYARLSTSVAHIPLSHMHAALSPSRPAPSYRGSSSPVPPRRPFRTGFRYTKVWLIERHRHGNG